MMSTSWAQAGRASMDSIGFLPFHLWGQAVLVGLSGLVASLIGHPEDAIIAAITTSVVLIVAEASPHQ